MTNPYFIIKKQPNQTWEQWQAKRKEGEEITVPWNWCFDRARKTMKRYTKEGFCKRVRSNRGLDVYKWTGNHKTE